MPDLSDLIHWLISIILGFSFVSLLAALRISRQREQQLQTMVRSLATEVGGLCSGAVGMGDRLLQLEQRIRQIAERQDRLDMNDNKGDNLYGQAIRLVQNGASQQDLMVSCGLTLSEAQLIVMLHGKKSVES